MKEEGRHPEQGLSAAVCQGIAGLDLQLLDGLKVVLQVLDDLVIGIVFLAELVGRLGSDFPQVVWAGDDLEQEALVGQDPLEFLVIGRRKDIQDQVDLSVQQGQAGQIADEPVDSQTAVAFGGQLDGVLGNIKGVEPAIGQLLLDLSGIVAFSAADIQNGLVLGQVPQDLQDGCQDMLVEAGFQDRLAVDKAGLVIVFGLLDLGSQVDIAKFGQIIRVAAAAAQAPFFQLERGAAEGAGQGSSCGEAL